MSTENTTSSDTPDPQPAGLPPVKSGWTLTVLLGGLVAMLAGWGTWITLKPMHKCTAIMATQFRTGRFPFDEVPGASVPAEETEHFRRSQRQWIRSEFVLRSAIQHLAPADRVVLDAQDDAVTWLQDHLDITFPDATDLLRLDLMADSPEGLPKILPAVVNAYFEKIVRPMRDEAERRILALEKARERCQNELRQILSEEKAMRERVEGNQPLQAAALRWAAERDEQDLARLRVEIRLTRTELDAGNSDVVVDGGASAIEAQVSRRMRADAVALQIEAEQQALADRLKRVADAPTAAESAEDELLLRFHELAERYSRRREILRQDLHDERRDAITNQKSHVNHRLARLHEEEQRLEQHLQTITAELKPLPTSVELQMIHGEIEIKTRFFQDLDKQLQFLKVSREEISDSGGCVVKPGVFVMIQLKAAGNKVVNVPHPGRFPWSLGNGVVAWAAVIGMGGSLRRWRRGVVTAESQQ